MNNLKAGISLVFIALVFSFTIFAQENKEANAKNSAAIEQLLVSLTKNTDEGKIDAAISDIEEILKLDPVDKDYIDLKSKLYYIRAAKYFVEENYGNALRDFNVSIQTNEKNSDALEARARLYLFQKDFDRAFADANSALKIDTKLPHAHAVLSGVYFNWADFNKSIEEANIALETDKDIMLALEYRGSSYSSLDKNALAVADLNRVIIKQPNNLNALIHRMISNAGLENWKATRNDANTILKFQDDSAVAFVFRGLANSGLNENFELIISDFNRTEKLSPELMNSDIYALRAIAFRKLGKITEAEQDEKKSEELRLIENKENEQ